MNRSLKALAIAGLLATSLLTTSAPVSAASLHALHVPPAFLKFAHSSSLSHAGIVLINPETKQVLFSSGPNVERAPASVLKLVSMTTAIETLGADKVFRTGIYESSDSAKSNTFVLIGQSDPWITTDAHSAKKYHRAFSPDLITAILNGHPGLSDMTLEYQGVYTSDITELTKFFKNIHFTLVPLTSPSLAESEKGAAIATIDSPPLSEIATFTLLWSDNTLADRLARISAHQLGLTTTTDSVQIAFEKTLGELGIDYTGLAVQDGNGLSHATRIKASTIAELLLKIKERPELQVIYNGLPLAGKTGTLKDRFIKDAPKAVGLVKAKTGWINTTVSLAGFVDVGAQQYVFTIIQDHVKNNEFYRQKTRETIDKMLATIARPKSA